MATNNGPSHDTLIRLESPQGLTNLEFNSSFLNLCTNRCKHGHVIHNDYLSRGTATKTLGGGSKYFLFSSLPGEMIQLTHIFQMGWNHQPVLLTVQLQICGHWWRLDDDARWLTLRLPDYRERLELNNPGLAIQRLLETCLRAVNWKVDYLDGTVFLHIGFRTIY